MAVLTAARFITITDAFAAALLALKGSGSTGTGDNTIEEPSDDTGLRGRLGDLNAAIMVFAEDDYIGLLDGIRRSEDLSGYQAVAPRIFSPALGELETLCAASGLAGVTSLTGFAAYYNTGLGGPYQALVAPDFGRGVYFLVNGANMDAKNVYAPAITNMATRAIASSTPGAFATGTDVDATKYAGAARLQAAMTGVTGTGTLVVVGSGRDANGATITGHTWTGSVSGNTTITLAPALAGDICTKVTSITFGAGITDATAVIGCAVPSGRSNPPT